jgi:hypothetical protein
MRTTLAIDPGTEQSAIVEWDGKQIQMADIFLNETLRANLKNAFEQGRVLVIEAVRCYGMTMGQSTIDTVFWSGRFAEAWGYDFFLMPRMDVKMHLCHTSRAKKKNTRQAMIDRFGKPPTKKEPNEVYNGFKIATHLWSAWELAVTYWDKTKAK